MVFNSRVTRLFVLCVLSVVVLQPTLLVYADTEASTSSDQPVPASDVDQSQSLTRDDVEIVTPTNASVDEVSSPTELVTEEVSEFEAAAQSADPAEKTHTEAAGASSSIVASSSAAEAASSSVSTVATAVSTSTASTSASTTLETGSATPELVEPDLGEKEVTAQTEATTTPFTNTVQTNDTYYQFSRDTCVRVGDGSFYCAEQGTKQPVADQFYVALDADGDKEIFARLSGVDIQLTYNRYEDAAPYYDAVSDTVVWHRLVDGRYQIMSYDFATEEETQLTTGRVNNMQPARHGDDLVWQQWHDGSWDIVHWVDGTETILGAADVPDIAPTINDTFITWNRVYTGEQQVVVFDRAAATELTVPESELGSSVRNARMLLVVEGVTTEGDTVIRGFDPVTRELVPIESQPAPLPERIPSSEPVSEVRAMVQPKPSTTEEVESDTSDGSGAAPRATAGATSTDQLDLRHTLQIPTATSSTSVVTESATTSVPQSEATSTFTLIIPPQSTSTEQ